MPAYFRSSVESFSSTEDNNILAALTDGFHRQAFAALRNDTIRSWKEELRILRTCVQSLLRALPDSEGWSLLLEFIIPRRSKRIDAVLLANDVIIVIEFKTGSQKVGTDARRQAEDYALDLRDFHEPSNGRMIVPLVVGGNPTREPMPDAIADKVQMPWAVADADLAESILATFRRWHSEEASVIVAEAWDEGRYHPTPTILESAEMIYAQHTAADVRCHLASQDDLDRTAGAVLKAISAAKHDSRKIICFLTGVPGAGKTLAGLNIVHNRALREEMGTPGVFLSGNGPLVEVLSEAIARDMAARGETRIGEARRKVGTFIRDMHEFLEYFTDEKRRGEIPNDRLILFDEAQRAWDQARGWRKFRRTASEPEMMLEIMSRIEGWCVFVALIGSGQEIHDGEAGLPEWGRALSDRYPKWRIHVSPQLLAATGSHSARPLFCTIPTHLDIRPDEDLHLSVPRRSYRSTAVAQWVDHVLNGECEKAKVLTVEMTQFPIVLTRSLERSRQWLRTKARGERRCGLVASSGARRLRPERVEVNVDFETPTWYLDGHHDVRSSNFLEIPATEFAIQGLELDWVGVCWDLDLRRTESGWKVNRFKGTRWTNVEADDHVQFAVNKYRVLLTRAREGIVIYVPRGDPTDCTRLPEWYDNITTFLFSCGVVSID